MLTSQKVIDAINEQIGYEFSAELQYYAIAAHFAAEALPQLSQHFFQQAEEENASAAEGMIRHKIDIFTLKPRTMAEFEQKSRSIWNGLGNIYSVSIDVLPQP